MGKCEACLYLNRNKDIRKLCETCDKPKLLPANILAYQIIHTYYSNITELRTTDVIAVLNLTRIPDELQDVYLRKITNYVITHKVKTQAKWQKQ